MTRLILTAVTAAALMTTPAFAERAPVTMGQDARVRHVTFNASDVIRIDTHLRVNTSIELGPGERINQVLIGDSVSFEVEVLSNRNVVSIKPVEARTATNMTIYTNRRAVAFSLTEGRSKTHSFRVVVNFPEDRPKHRQLTGGRRDLGYQYAGSGDLRPLRVWNDGRSTFFEFRPGLRPSIFGLNGKGYEITLNSQTRGEIVRVPGIRDAYTIRMGETFVCITRDTGGFTDEPATVAALRQREF
ncbi:MAG: TrbG/VirB9 family P-type conjugative transfer protein [Marinovum algicola]|uniref:TrbG/VirB9 family P-type conjugative transfer protein n=1 Tax=Roseobacteraceae TaxID=2854170 RepID=UPI0032F0748C